MNRNIKLIVGLLGLLGLVHASSAADTAADAAAAQQRLQGMGVEPNVERLIQHAAQGDATTLDLILAAGVAVTASDSRRQVTALHNAAAQGHLRIVTHLLDLGAQVDAADWRGATPLIDAAYYAHDTVVAALLQHGADCNARPAHAPTALVAAVEGGDLAVIERLLAGGAKPALADFSGLTPLAAAQRAQRSDIAARIEHAAGQGDKP